MWQMSGMTSSLVGQVEGASGHDVAADASAPRDELAQRLGRLAPLLGGEIWFTPKNEKRATPILLRALLRSPEVPAERGLVWSAHPDMPASFEILRPSATGQYDYVFSTDGAHAGRRYSCGQMDEPVRAQGLARFSARNTFVHDGGTLRLHCTASGHPPPDGLFVVLGWLLEDRLPSLAQLEPTDRVQALKRLTLEQLADAPDLLARLDQLKHPMWINGHRLPRSTPAERHVEPLAPLCAAKRTRERLTSLAHQMPELIRHHGSREALAKAHGLNAATLRHHFDADGALIPRARGRIRTPVTTHRDNSPPTDPPSPDG